MRKHWPRVLGGLAAAAYLLYLGIDGIVSRVSFSIATALVSGSIGRSFSYTVYGTQAIVMGIGWISAAIAAFAGLALQPVLPLSRPVELTRDIALFAFAACFVYVAFHAVKQLLAG